VEDLDGEVLPLLTEHLLALLLQDLAGSVVGIDDVVAELELDVLDLALLEGLEKLLFDLVSDGPVLLVIGPAVVTRRPRVLQVCK
jgi:hypothetical protein